MDAIANHWPVILAIAGVLINILQAATRHWSEWPKLVKWLGFLVEVLSIVTSRGVRMPAKPSKLKAPLQSARPQIAFPKNTEPRKVTVVGALMIVLALGGCSVGWRDAAQRGLRSAHEGAIVAYDAVQPRLLAKCEALAYQCSASGDSECEPAEECLRRKAAFAGAIKSLQLSLAAAQAAIDAVPE